MKARRWKVAHASAGGEQRRRGKRRVEARRRLVDAGVSFGW